MHIRRLYLNGIAFVAFLGAMLPVCAYAEANLSFSPASGSYASGKTFTVQVIADSGTQTFNSANATLNFDKELLQVQSIAKTGSAFALWAVEPSFSNAQGTVNFEGGNTTPVSGKRQLISVTFKAVKEGKAALSFGAASVLAADGKGTDIVGTKTPAEFEITASSKDPTPPPADTGGDAPPQGDVLIPKPDAPVISSPTHAEENKWYNAPKAKFVWDMPPDVTVVRLALDTVEKTDPKTTYDPAISDKEFDSIQNGVMYFHLKYKNDAGWGPAAHRKIQVDKDPPPAFTLEIVDPKEGGSATLKFMATDTLSGIERYEMSIDGGAPLKVNVNEVKESGYQLSGQLPGSHTISIKAFDRAGNSSETQGTFLIPGELPKEKKTTEEEEKPTNWNLIGNIVLVAILAFMIGYIVYERGAFRHEKYVAKREADEVRDTVSNVFAALREEIDEQSGLLFQKPNPSALDREVMMRMNEALDLSEELIAKEVEDVRKLLM